MNTIYMCTRTFYKFIKSLNKKNVFTCLRMHFATQMLEISFKGLNQLELAPLKNLFFLAVLKLDVKDSFGCNKEIESMGKTFPII